MNCEALHSRLLGSEKPDRLTADLAAHLKSCAACRKWQRRLLHLERNVALLPVAPAPRGKLEFVRQFVAAELEPLPAECEVASESTNGATTVQTWKFEKLAAALRSSLNVPRATLNAFPAPARRRIAAVLAASLLLLAFGLWINSPTSPFTPKPPDPLLASVVDRDLRLAAAKTPSECVETLADLADDLQGTTRTLIDAGQPDDLKALADLYEQVVRDGIVLQAKLLSPEEKARLLEGIAKRLVDAGDKAEERAKVLPESSAAPLNIIARAARDGDRRLHVLIRESRS